MSKDCLKCLTVNFLLFLAEKALTYKLTSWQSKSMNLYQQLLLKFIHLKYSLATICKQLCPTLSWRAPIRKSFCLQLFHGKFCHFPLCIPSIFEVNFSFCIYLSVLGCWGVTQWSVCFYGIFKICFKETHSRCVNRASGSSQMLGCPSGPALLQHCNSFSKC